MGFSDAVLWTGEIYQGIFLFSGGLHSIHL